MKVFSSIVVSVNWKAAADTLACVDSLRQLEESDWRLLICENGSPDGSLNILREGLCCWFVEHSRNICEQGVLVFDYFDGFSPEDIPVVTLVFSEKNLGFAGGNNLALRHCHEGIGAEFYWFLNNDTLVERNTLSVLLAKMRSDESLGICGASLVYQQQRDRVQALGGAKYWPSTGRLCEIGQGNVWPLPIDEKAIEVELDYVSGASMFVRSALIEKIGLMAEDYFLYYEELDWAVRAKEAGFRLGYASRAVVYHKEGAVLGSGKSTKRSMLAEYYGLRNRLVFTWRYYPLYMPSVLLFSWLQVGRRLLHGEWAKAKMMMQVLLGLRSTAP